MSAKDRIYDTFIIDEVLELVKKKQVSKSKKNKKKKSKKK